MVRATDPKMPQAATPSRGPSLLHLWRQSGDANLGQTLIRLAAQAAEEHRAQARREEARR